MRACDILPKIFDLFTGDNREIGTLTRSFPFLCFRLTIVQILDWQELKITNFTHSRLESYFTRVTLYVSWCFSTYELVSSHRRSAARHQTQELRRTPERSVLQWVNVPQIELVRVRPQAQRSQFPNVRWRPAFHPEIQRGLDQPRSDHGWIAVFGHCRPATIQSKTQRQITEQRLAQCQSLFQTRQSYVERGRPHAGN